MPIPQDLADFRADEIIQIADSTCKENLKWIKTNQIRNVFSHISSIKMDFKANKKYNDKISNDLIMLKPKLAYASGRQSGRDKRNYEVFMNTLWKAVDGVINSRDQDKAFENFLNFVEAIVAYHKYHGGQDK